MVNRGDGWPIDVYTSPRHQLGEVFETEMTLLVEQAIEQGYLIVLSDD